MIQTRTAVLQIDRILCDGYGMCAELLPEMIELDDWGYPIFRRSEVPANLMEHAERAVAVCPVLALKLARPTTAGLTPPGRRER
jgi:ferredoxin